MWSKTPNFMRFPCFAGWYKVSMKKYLCLGCGFSYDEARGLPEHGIAPDTRWADVVVYHGTDTPNHNPTVTLGASAVVGDAFTVTATIDGLEVSAASLTTSWNVSVTLGEPLGITGAVKNGVADVALERRTAGPSTCVQW